MPLTRRILFWVFTALYVVLCPLLLFYSFGFIFNPVKGRLTQTGLIYLSSTPPGAAIYLEKSRYAYKTPASLTELLAGTYRVTLRLKDHRPWQHTVSIESGKAVAFENILLIPNTIKTDVLLPGPYEDLVPLVGMEYLVLKKGGDLGEHFFFDCKKQEVRPVVSRASSFYDFPVNAFFTQEASDVLVVYGGPLWSKKYLYVRLKRKELLRDVTQMFAEKAEEVRWLPRHDTVLFSLRNRRVSRMDVATLATDPAFCARCRGFGLHGAWVYQIDEAGVVSRKPYDAAVQEKAAEEIDFPPGFADDADFYDIHVLGAGHIVFLSQKGRLRLNQPPYDLVDKGVRGIAYDEKNRLLAYWTKDSIAMADLRERGVEEGNAAPGFIQPRVVYSAGRDIKQCFWAYDATHLIFRDGDNISIIEIEPDGQHHIDPLVRTLHETTVFYAEESGRLYYLEPSRGDFMMTEVVPKSNLVLAPFLKKEDVGVKEDPKGF